jgi:hypothetical protein
VLSASLPDSQRKDFESGFRTGALMIHEALKWGQRPFKPVLDPAGSAAFRPAGPDAMVASAVLTEPRPELDAETGLIRLALSPEDPFARGLSAGFDWAMQLEGQTLRRPAHPPSLPNNWTRWPQETSTVRLQDQDRHLILRWGGGLLAWNHSLRGFPGQRRWRPWADPGPPAWVAFSPQALWVETAAGRALALDLDSGAILAVTAPAEHPKPSSVSEAEAYRDYLARLKKDPDHLKRIAKLTVDARAGNLPAMLELARTLKGIDEAADQEAFQWFLRAAEAGSREAMLEVGTCRYHGQGCVKDRPAARGWFQRAADAGDATAAAVLAELFKEPASF